jgi:hypothetical protein
MKRSTIVRTGAVGAVCALAGSAAGIAASSASTPHKTPGVPLARRLMFKAGPLAGAVPGLGFVIPGGGPAGPAVHSEAVVPNEKGGFDTITMDRGTYSSLSGDQLTITEGTKTATYKTVTLTIPTNATVRRNDAAAHLSDIKSGDTVMVAQSPQGTVVDARDAQHTEQMPLTFRAFQHGGMPRPPKLPPMPEEGASAPSGEGQVVVPPGAAY